MSTLPGKFEHRDSPGVLQSGRVSDIWYNITMNPALLRSWYNLVIAILIIPRIIRDKLGDDVAEALVELINKSESSDIIRLEGKIDTLEVRLEGKLKLYFVIMIVTVIFSNPRVMDFIGKLLCVIK
ncbi:MAG: hypothetical protein HQK96_13465 [Nitrospirae bacterium]|nr:hypothetical protein [Nitrospirota bacterium]